MKQKNNQITVLSADIKQIIQEKHGESFEMLRLCRDHQNSVTLNDKKSVLAIAQDDLVGIFDMKSGHFFLNPEQVLRLAIFCELPLPGTLALILKAEWEYLLANSFDSDDNKSINYNLMFKNKMVIEKFSLDFIPDKGGIINLLIDFGNRLKIDFEIDKVELYIQDLLVDLNFLKSNNRVCEHYNTESSNEKKLLLQCSESEKQNYYQLKELWRYKSNELSEYLFMLEKKKRVHTNVENRYFRIFGNQELKKLRWTNREKKYKAILLLMTDYHDLSFRELLKMVNDYLEENQKEKAELKNKIDRSLTMFDVSAFSGINSVVTDEFRNTYVAECKKMLRKLYMLLHSDTCPSYANLSEKKKKQINALWLKLMKTTNGELYSYSPTMLLYQYPDLNVLQEIYVRACQILGISPDFVEPTDRLEFMISKGATLQKVIGFLGEEIEKIDLHLAQLELVQTEYSQDEETEYCRSALESVEPHQQRLKKEIIELQEEVANLKKQIKLNLISEKV